MDIKNFFRGMFGGGQNVLHTPYGDLHLAKSSDRKRVKKMVIELERTTDALTRRDIADWRQAWQMAINVDSPNRQRLYDIYRDVEIDLHLSGCVRQRVGFVMAKSFKLVDAKGNEDEEAHHYFDQSWFNSCLICTCRQQLGTLAHRAWRPHHRRRRLRVLYGRETHSTKACHSRIRPRHSAARAGLDFWHRLPLGSVYRLAHRSRTA